MLLLVVTSTGRLITEGSGAMGGWAQERLLAGAEKIVRTSVYRKADLSTYWTFS